jgi:isopenicillin N synthase-like dioxygenase
LKEQKLEAVAEQVDELRTAISNNTGTPIADVKITKAEIAEIEKAVDQIFEQTFFGAGKQYFKSFSGSSDYIRSIYPKLRSETTPLFFDTLKTSIRQAARSNLEVITRGPIEGIAKFL